jgi:lipoteichoic acid synthase
MSYAKEGLSCPWVYSPSMSKEKLQKLSGIVLPMGTFLLLLLSSYLQHYHILGWERPIEVPSLEPALLFVVVGVVSLVPRRFQYWICGALLLVTQFVGFIDVNYYRFFNDLPSLHLLPTWFQAGRIGASVGAGLLWSDTLLLLPLFLFGVLCLGVRWGFGSEERTLWISALFTGFSLGMAVLTWNSMHPVRHIQLQRRFQNKAIQQLFGPQFYHYYDLFEWLRVTLGLEGGRALDRKLVEEAVGFSRELSTAETEFKGRYSGRDLVFIQLESLEYFAINAEYDGQPIMPFLYQAQERVFSFRLFDQTHLGRSADGQFIFLNSLHPPASRPLPFVYPTNTYHGLPKLFLEAGYETYYFEPVESSFWNAGAITTSYGFHQKYFKDELRPVDSKKDVRGWGLTDAALFDHVLNIVRTASDPYFMYVVTVMCHHPYSETSNVPVDFPPKKSTSMVRRYLRCASARDKAVKDFMLELSTTERGRRTVVCLAGDHDANLPGSEMKRLGYPIYPEREAIPLMLGSVEEFLGMTPEPNRPVPPRDFGAQMDIAPSLGHVFSLNMEESVFVGWNLFATQNRGPYNSRVGTWMDQTGRIQETEKAQDWSDSRLFEVSEMLLQGDKIGDFRKRF